MRHLLLAAIVLAGAQALTGFATAQDAAGAIVFQTQCAGCHSVDEGKTIVGPSLFGIVGRQAGQVPGFRYSPANKASGVTWTEATLDAYLANPRAVIPRTTMPYAGLKDAGKRSDLIAYLATIH
jgi:cytochrome c